jgi:putative membrane protein
MFKGIVLFAALATSLAPMASAQLSSTDKAFVMKTARANNYEIQAAQLALSMSQNDAYKTYAQMMIDDHTKAGQDLAAAVTAADPSVQLPTGVSASDQTKLDTLKNAKSTFDLKYRQQMIAGHAMLHSFFQDYLQGANNNAGIKAVIQNIQPVVTKHWNEAKKLPRQ